MDTCIGRSDSSTYAFKPLGVCGVDTAGQLVGHEPFHHEGNPESVEALSDESL